MQLDHVVYFSSKNPQVLMRDQDTANLRPHYGGQHEQWGTENVLLTLNNAYIEWLLVKDEAVFQRANNPLIALYRFDRAEKDGWGTICLSVTGIENLRNRLLKNGYETTEVIHAQRTTATGEVKRWKMLFIKEEPSEKLPFPFFIEWEIVEQKQNEPNTKSTFITACVFETTTPFADAKKWSHIFGLEEPKEPVIELPNCRLTFEKQHILGKSRLKDIQIKASPKITQEKKRD